MIKYPTKNAPAKETKIGQPLGMLFEKMLNKSNEYYLNANRAVIYKKPTPIKIVKVSYPKRSRAKITEAYFQVASTTDYNGIYRGRYLDYEAKQTNSLAFSFTHISTHQINHLVKVAEHGGIAFILIYFKERDEVYLLDINVFMKHYEAGFNGGRRSIPLEVFQTEGVLAPRGYTPLVDYLAAVDQYYFQ